ncbi:hypothetical protein [Nocardiopsis sp. CNT312]|uniref:hypothetical protein n=1 Tax=Nocardiopsis sp. CNT312 TaxID=1137268 RepID=UPI0004B419EF|nr:hypothetical protein [Nocardiopsis sp. CNT312]
MGAPPDPAKGRHTLPRSRFDQIRLQAALRGLVLTRYPRLLGAIYTLALPNKQVAICHDLTEVQQLINRHPPRR